MAKQTGTLSVIGDSGMSEKDVHIHPNDGYDLGLMTLTHVVRIFVGESPTAFADGSGKNVYGTLHLKNECRMGTCEMSLKALEKLGGSKRVQITYDKVEGDSHGKILIAPA